MSAQVWWEAAGAPDAPIVAVVHGSMDRAAGLLRLSRRLVSSYRVLRYDRRGYGRSAEVGPPWTVAANIDDLELLLEPMLDGSDGPAVVFGHSFGGNVALGLAARRPDLVRGIVVYETPLSWLDWWPGNSAGAAAMAVDDAGDAAEAFMRRLVGDAVWERLPASKRAERRAEGRAMVAELADLRRQAPWFGDDISVPVLAMFGEHARPHHRIAMIGLADMIVGCRSVMVSGAGHAGPHSHADAVRAAMAPFLESLSDVDRPTVG
jgi:pimeloyl-ACP methyl ester carboxylesterase